MNWTYILVPLISALIGWLANRMLIKMLFRPVKPVRVLGITIQGIFPKRQEDLAAKLGKLVSTELFSFSDIEEKITHPDNIKKILPYVEQHIDEFLRQRLKEVFPMISMFIGEKTINQLKTVFMDELERLFPVLMKNYMTNLQQDLDLEKIVTEKLSAFPIEKLESALYESMGAELRLAGIFGAVIGLLIGLLQVLLIIVLG